MKPTRLLLALCALPFALCGLASGQTIEVVSLSDVRIDGQSAGQLADVIANHRHLASAVQAAALQWHAAQLSEGERSRAEAVAKADAALAAKDSELSALKSQVSALEAAAAESAARFAALVPLLDNIEASAIPAEQRAALKAARKTEKQRQREALQAQRAQLDAELAKLSTP